MQFCSNNSFYFFVKTSFIRIARIAGTCVERDLSENDVTQREGLSFQFQMLAGVKSSAHSSHSRDKWFCCGDFVLIFQQIVFLLCICVVCTKEKTNQCIVTLGAKAKHPLPTLQNANTKWLKPISVQFDLVVVKNAYRCPLQKEGTKAEWTFYSIIICCKSNYTFHLLPTLKRELWVH